MFALYKHYDKDGVLLYVGASLQAFKRMEQHSSNSTWFRDISEIKFEWYDSKFDLMSAESKAIDEELPRYNKIAKVGDAMRVSGAVKIIQPVTRGGELLKQVIDEKGGLSMQEARHYIGASEDYVFGLISGETYPTEVKKGKMMDCPFMRIPFLSWDEPAKISIDWMDKK